MSDSDNVLKVLVASDTRVRLIGKCTKNFHKEYLGKRNGWSWQGGLFHGLPPHWVWGVKRGETPGGLDASIDLIGQLLRDKRIGKVEIDYTGITAAETTVSTPSKRASDAQGVQDVDPHTTQTKKART